MESTVSAQPVATCSEAPAAACIGKVWRQHYPAASENELTSPLSRPLKQLQDISRAAMQSHCSVGELEGCVMTDSNEAGGYIGSVGPPAIEPLQDTKEDGVAMTPALSREPSEGGLSSMPCEGEGGAVCAKSMVMGADSELAPAPALSTPCGEDRAPALSLPFGDSGGLYMQGTTPGVDSECVPVLIMLCTEDGGAASTQGLDSLQGPQLSRAMSALAGKTSLDTVDAPPQHVAEELEEEQQDDNKHEDVTDVPDSSGKRGRGTKARGRAHAEEGVGVEVKRARGKK